MFSFTYIDALKQIPKSEPREYVDNCLDPIFEHIIKLRKYKRIVENLIEQAEDLKCVNDDVERQTFLNSLSQLPILPEYLDAKSKKNSSISEINLPAEAITKLLSKAVARILYVEGYTGVPSNLLKLLGKIIEDYIRTFISEILTVTPEGKPISAEDVDTTLDRRKFSGINELQSNYHDHIKKLSQHLFSTCQQLDLDLKNSIKKLEVPSELSFKKRKSEKRKLKNKISTSGNSIISNKKGKKDISGGEVLSLKLAKNCAISNQKLGKEAFLDSTPIASETTNNSGVKNTSSNENVTNSLELSNLNEINMKISKKTDNHSVCDSVTGTDSQNIYDSINNISNMNGSFINSNEASEENIPSGSSIKIIFESEVNLDNDLKSFNGKTICMKEKLHNISIRNLSEKKNTLNEIKFISEKIAPVNPEHTIVCNPKGTISETVSSESEEESPISKRHTEITDTIDFVSHNSSFVKYSDNCEEKIVNNADVITSKTILQNTNENPFINIIHPEIIGNGDKTRSYKIKEKPNEQIRDSCNGKVSPIEFSKEKYNIEPTLNIKESRFKLTPKQAFLLKEKIKFSPLREKIEKLQIPNILKSEEIKITETAKNNVESDRKLHCQLEKQCNVAEVSETTKENLSCQSQNQLYCINSIEVDKNMQQNLSAQSEINQTSDITKPSLPIQVNFTIDHQQNVNKSHNTVSNGNVFNSNFCFVEHNNVNNTSESTTGTKNNNLSVNKSITNYKNNSFISIKRNQYLKCRKLWALKFKNRKRVFLKNVKLLNAQTNKKPIVKEALTTSFLGMFSSFSS